jgi:hypothetical protein
LGAGAVFRSTGWCSTGSGGSVPLTDLAQAGGLNIKQIKVPNPSRLCSRYLNICC